MYTVAGVEEEKGASFQPSYHSGMKISESPLIITGCRSRAVYSAVTRGGKGGGGMQAAEKVCFIHHQKYLVDQHIKNIDDTAIRYNFENNFKLLLSTCFAVVFDF